MSLRAGKRRPLPDSLAAWVAQDPRECGGGGSSLEPGGCGPQVWDEWQEVTPDTVLTHFTFSIPPDGPPSFATPAISLRWLLRFQFTAGAVPHRILLSLQLHAAPRFARNVVEHHYVLPAPFARCWTGCVGAGRIRRSYHRRYDAFL